MVLVVDSSSPEPPELPPEPSQGFDAEDVLTLAHPTLPVIYQPPSTFA